MPRKSEESLRRFCPKCGSPKIKSWDEFSGDEKFMIERVSGADKYSAEEKKRHRFCARCFYEFTNHEAENV